MVKCKELTKIIGRELEAESVEDRAEREELVNHRLHSLHCSPKQGCEGEGGAWGGFLMGRRTESREFREEGR